MARHYKRKVRAVPLHRTALLIESRLRRIRYRRVRWYQQSVAHTGELVNRSATSLQRSVVITLRRRRRHARTIAFGEYFDMPKRDIPERTGHLVQTPARSADALLNDASSYKDGRRRSGKLGGKPPADARSSEFYESGSISSWLLDLCELEARIWTAMTLDRTQRPHCQ
ncbi:hypothetical protein PENSPDRAFT_663490 [Peniophora sp. CONT]|nr:hypothetical protein PENSPDRAFT_663490 [Peniophora sp. CONT]